MTIGDVVSALEAGESDLNGIISMDPLRSAVYDAMLIAYRQRSAVKIVKDRTKHGLCLGRPSKSDANLKY